MDEIDRSQDHKFHNLGVTIAFFFGVSFVKCVIIYNQVENLLTQ